MMKKRNMILLMVVIVMGIFVLSACSGGEEKQDGQGEQKEESSADLGQFAAYDGDTWMESWNGKTASGIDFSAKLNAYMSVPKLKSMSTVEVRKYTFNNENKKKLAEGIFEKDIYYYDPKYMPESELKQLLEGAESGVRYYEDQLEELKEGNTESGSSQSEIEELIKKLKEKVKKYKKFLKKAPKEFQKVQDDNFDGDRFLGERDGIRFILRCDIEEETGQEVMMGLEPYDDEEVKPDRMKGKGGFCYPGEEGKEIENECGMEKEEAEKLAREFLQKTGFTELVQQWDSVLMWDMWNDASTLKENPDESFADGWVFNYAPGVDGVSFPSFGIEGEYKTVVGSVSHKGYSLNCCMNVYVTDKGVISATWFNPIEIVSITSDVKMLPVDSIKNIVKDELGVLADYLSETGFFVGMSPSVSFNRMDLVYYRVSDPEDEERFTYIPAWKLWSNTGNLKPFKFVVNAIDGSVVDDWESEWQITPPEGSE